MCSIFMIVADSIRKQPLQMPLVDYDHMIDQVAPATLNPALGHAVLPGALVRGLNRLYLHRSCCHGNFQSVFCISVKDKESGNRVEREGLSQLLHHPHARRVLGDVEVQDAPPVMTDDEETVEYSERDRRNCEEVHCSDGLPMIPKKCQPSLDWLRISWRLPHPSGDGSFRDIEAEHEKLSVNPRCTPRRIFGNHAEDQLSELLREDFPASRLLHFGDQFPIKTEASPVPPHDCLRRHNNQRVLPLGPNPPGRYPKQLVEGIQSWSRMAAFEHRELLSQCEIFQQETTTGTKQTCNRPNAKPNRREHRSDITQIERMRPGLSY